MSDRSKIEWTDSTWNPIRARLKHSTIDNLGGAIGWHCVHVSEGCRNCYAEGINRRLGTGLDYKPGNQNDIEIFLDEKTLLQPLKWRKPRKIFPGSMTDLFGPWVTDEMLDRIWAVMALCPHHTFQVLTKRPERMRKYFDLIAQEMEADDWNGEPPKRFDGHVVSLNHSPWELSGAGWPIPNVWLGVSCEDQATADERIPLLLQTPAAVRFISAEPLLGPIDLAHILEATGFTFNALVSKEGIGFRGRCLDWVIVGGESGKGARPFNIAWARHIAGQCKAAGVSCFIKQLGSKPFYQASDANCTSQDTGRKVQLIPKDRKGGDWSEWPAELRVREFPHKAPGIVAITPQPEEERADV